MDNSEKNIIFKEIQEILGDSTFYNPSLEKKLNLDTVLSDIVDSLEVLEMVMLLEEKFDITIANVHNIRTVSDLCDAIITQKTLCFGAIVNAN